MAVSSFYLSFTLQYSCINHRDQRVFFQIEIIINVLVSSSRFIEYLCYGYTDIIHF